MCGRIIQASPPDLLALRIVNGLEDRDNRVPAGTNSPPCYKGAPSQRHWVIRRNPQTGECSLDLLQWGLLPNWCKDPKAVRPINAMAETVAMKPYFREAYQRRRCIVPVDGFFEWMAVKGSKVKQPYAIAMKDRSPFWHRWPVGELARPGDLGMAPDVRDHHGPSQRARLTNSRPDARDPCA
jgi:putative SOS response-associated peptidase YedK